MNTLLSLSGIGLAILAPYRCFLNGRVINARIKYYDDLIEGHKNKTSSDR